MHYNLTYSTQNGHKGELCMHVVILDKDYRDIL